MRLFRRRKQPKLTGQFVRNGVCAGCGPWCKDHGWRDPEVTGNPEVDLAAAKAFAARVTAHLDRPEGSAHA